MSSNPDTQRALYALAFFFGELDLDPHIGPLPWPIWDGAMIERWGMRPVDNGQPPREYFKRHDIRDTLHLPIDQALHAFHEHHWRISPETFAAFLKYEQDFEQVMPFLEEEPMTEANWRAKEQEVESFDPRNPSRRRATTFAPGGPASGIKHDDEWAVEREGRPKRDR